MKKYKTCLRCGRKLKSEESKTIGFGKVCWEKYKSEDNFKKLFDLEDSNEKNNSDTNFDNINN